MCQPKKRHRWIIWHGMTLLLASFALAGCKQAMDNMAYYRPYEESDVFPDHQSARLPVGGTIARGQLTVGTLATGSKDGRFAESLPFPLTKEHLKRGQERFDIYCTPCHGYTGDGNGMIVQRGFPNPPNFHTERLRSLPDGYIFAVITNGGGNVMPNYSVQIEPVDRWLIVAYVRALQLSQQATVDDLPPEAREKLGEPSP